jgi:hypothetical protein
VQVRVGQARAQQREQRVALVGVQARDPAHVGAAQVERRALRHRVDAHERVAHALEAVGDAAVDLLAVEVDRGRLVVGPRVEVLLEVGEEPCIAGEGAWSA